MNIFQWIAAFLCFLGIGAEQEAEDPLAESSLQIEKEWHSNGAIRNISSYSNGLPHGWHRKWDENSSLLYEAKFHEGKCIGLLREWYQGNVPKMIAPHSEGSLHGKVDLFHPNGRMASSDHYKWGILDGESRSWFESGGLKKIAYFKEGHPIGTHKEFYELEEEKKESVIARVLRFFDGKLHGKQEYYHPNGEKKEILHYKNGLLHGLFQNWSPDGVLLFEAEYREGTPHDISHP